MKAVITTHMLTVPEGGGVPAGDYPRGTVIEGEFAQLGIDSGWAQEIPADPAPETDPVPEP